MHLQNLSAGLGVCLLGRLASKLSGSSDLYWNRSPLASINFITAHDGFTLWDLVSYQNKRNQANGEDNRDGTNDNYGWNCGVEGPTSDPQILNLRLRQARNMLLSTILSQGVPMLLGGDEIARTQRGNNNAYCQDNELSYYDWKLTPSQRQLYSYTQTLLELRRLHPAFRRQGIGTQLLRAAAAQFFADGGDLCSLSLPEEAQEGLAFARGLSLAQTGHEAVFAL